MRHLYGEDLAYIHDAGFGDFAAGAAPGILRILKDCGVNTGLVVDLGCGSGVWAEFLHRSGYKVLGVDASAAMIRLARRRAPLGKLVKRSLQTIALPACAAVTAIGESLNYLPRSGSTVDLAALFRRVFAALRPGGVFVFDIAQSRLARAEHDTTSFAEGKDWAVVVEKRADLSRRLLERRIIAFRRMGKLYRRSEEIHQLELYNRAEIISLLEHAGFRPRVLSSYGKQRILPGRAGFLAVKPK
jgi:SAM-dependent methyltransferase